MTTCVLKSTDRAFVGGVPVRLGTYVDITAVRRNNVWGSPDLAKLQNNTRAPMMIDEINFMTSAPAATYNEFAGVGLAADVLASVQFKLGRIMLTDKPIPLHCLGSRPQALGYDAADFQDGAYSTFNWFFRWKLPVPLYVAPGDVLAPTFMLGPWFDSAEVDFLGPTRLHISYGGRRLPQNTPAPDLVAVPHVGLFKPQMTNVADDFEWDYVFDHALSDAKDLYNPYTVPLYVQRFIGQIGNHYVLYQEWQPRFSDSEPAPLDYSGANAAEFPIKITMKDSQGYDIIKDPAYWNDVFDPERRCWTFGRQLDPKQWYAMKLDNIPTGAWFGGGADGFVQPYVSMVGYRYEEFAR